MSPRPAVQPRVWPYPSLSTESAALTRATALRGRTEQLAVGPGTGSTFTWLNDGPVAREDIHDQDCADR
jgi:hypothetical protein